VAETLLVDLHTQGQFNLRYWGRNIWAMLLALPARDPTTNLFAPSTQGMSLLLTTPALVFLVRAIWPWPRRFIMAGAWAALGCTAAVLLSYYNTGATQFGYRFSLDFMTEVIVLLACALIRISRVMQVLIVAGIAINAYGVGWFSQYAVAAHP
jgi:hypothetical protein